MSEDFTGQAQIVTRLDPHTGDVTVEHRLQGQLLPSVRLSGANVERYAGWLLIEDDLEASLNWYRKSEDLRNEHSPQDGSRYSQIENRDVLDIVKALFVASLTFYGKAFADAEGRRVRMRREQLNESFRRAHDDFIRYRHQLAAHSGADKIESAVAHAYLMPLDDGAHLNISLTGIQPSFLADQNNQSFETLIEHALQVSRFEREKMHDYIMRRASNAGFEFWIEATTRGRPVDIDFLFRR